MGEEKKPLRRLKRTPVRIKKTKRTKRAKTTKKKKIGPLRNYYKWVSVDDEMPNKFSLVKIKYVDEKTHPGWWTGFNWDSGRKLRGARIVAWKKEHSVGYFKRLN